MFKSYLQNSSGTQKVEITFRGDRIVFLDGRSMPKARLKRVGLLTWAPSFLDWSPMALLGVDLVNRAIAVRVNSQTDLQVVK